MKLGSLQESPRLLQAPSARDYAIKRDPVETYQENKDKLQKHYNFVCSIANICPLCYFFGEHAKPAHDPDETGTPTHKAFRCGRNLLDEKSIPYRDQFKDAIHFVADALVNILEVILAFAKLREAGELPKVRARCITCT
jgi:hypothetical protein